MQPRPVTFKRMNGVSVDEPEWFENFVAHFRKNYKSHEDAVEEIYVRAKIDASTCFKCSKKNVPRSWGARELKCDRCSQKRHITAKTYFHGMRHALGTLFILMLLNQSVMISSSYCSKLKFLGIAQSTAWVLIKKFLKTILERMGDNAEEILSAFYTDIYTKHSLETPTREHPSKEQEAFEKEHAAHGEDSSMYENTSGEENPDEEQSSNTSNGDHESKAETQESGDFVRQSQNEELKKKERANPFDIGDDFNGDPQAETALNVMSGLSDTPIHLDDLFSRMEVPISDLLSVLLRLEISGRVQRLHGDWFKRKNGSKQSKATSKRLSSNQSGWVNGTVDYGHRLHHGVSRKHAQLYAVAYWCFSNPSMWKDCSVFEFLRDREPPTRLDILQYVTPLMIKACSAA